MTAAEGQRVGLFSRLLNPFGTRRPSRAESAAAAHNLPAAGGEGEDFVPEEEVEGDRTQGDHLMMAKAKRQQSREALPECDS